MSVLVCFRPEKSRVEDCSLNRIGSLSFTFHVGACTTTGDDQIFLCFDDKNTQGCRYSNDPLSHFQEEIYYSNFLNIISKFQLRTLKNLSPDTKVLESLHLKIQFLLLANLLVVISIIMLKLKFCS